MTVSNTQFSKEASNERPFWNQEVFIDAAWLRGTETVESIADRIDRITELLQQDLGITPWKKLHYAGEFWPTEREAHLAAIRKRVMTDDDGNPEPESGYLITLASTITRDPARGMVITLGARAGVTFSEAPHCLETARIQITAKDLFAPPPAEGAHVTIPMAETALRTTITVWDPLYANISSDWEVPGEPRERRPFLRGTPWSLHAGYRLWLSDALGPINKLAPGVTSSRLFNGTLLAVPDTWTPQHAAHAMFTTLDHNNLDEIPHTTTHPAS